MSDVDEKSQTMASECLGEATKEKETVQLSGRRTKQTAPNIIIGKRCQGCNNDVFVDKEAIQCHLCKDWIHGTNCIGFEDFWVAAPTTFTTHILPAWKNKPHAKSKKKKAGNFWFVCDCCATDDEERSVVSTMDKVEVLEQKIVSVKNNLSDEIADLKNLILSMDRGSVTSSSSFVAPSSPSSASDLIRAETSVETRANVWNDSQRVDRLKHLIALKKTDDGEKVDPKKLERIIVENGIKVHKTFELKKSTDTGVVLNSKEDADFLIEKLENELPQHRVSLVSNRIPSITIVGLEREFSNEELTNMIVNQNPGIKAIRESSNTSPADGTLDIVKIQPLRNNSTVFKAIVRVSNLIRSVISKQGDRLFMGSKTCKVYDFVFALRCYNCQVFGHHSRDCKEDPACAHCAGNHETRLCGKKSLRDVVKCKNCSDANKSDTAHEASSYECPFFLEKRNSIMKTIPFHQGKK